MYKANKLYYKNSVTRFFYKVILKIIEKEIVVRHSLLSHTFY